MEGKQRTSHLSYLGEQDAYVNHVLMAMNVNLMITSSGVNFIVWNHYFVHLLSEILPEPLKLASFFITQAPAWSLWLYIHFLLFNPFSPPPSTKSKLSEGKDSDSIPQAPRSETSNLWVHLDEWILPLEC